MTKTTDFDLLTGAGVDTAADFIPIIDDSETGVDRNKRILVDEVKLALDLASDYVPLTYLDTDGTLAANSDAKIATQKAVKTFVAASVAGLLDLKGDQDCSANPNYPAALKGDAYYVTVAGKIGGASGESVDVGDVFIASADNAGGTEASVGTSWFVLEHNLASVLTGSIASTTEQLTGTDNTKVSTPDSVAALWEQGSDIASAGTISVGEGGYFNITGTTTITDIDFGTDKAGRKVWVKFAGVLTLTHHSTTLILPTGANITTAAGDTACFVSEGSDNVRCVAYHRASGAALVAGTSFAVGSDYLTGTSSTKALTPDAVWDAAAYVALNDSGGNIAVDLSTGINFSMTMDGDYTLSAPTNGKAGQTGCIVLTQDGTGTQTLAYNAAWKFAGGTDPVLSTAPATVDILFYQVLANGTDVYANLVKAIA